MTLLQAPRPISSAGLGQASVVALVAHARSVPSLRREAFAEALGALGEGPGHVVLHTCHRVELYVAPAAFGGELPPIPPGTEVLEDAAAVRHLASVACGLDSVVFGEAQILHQLRETIADRRSDRALDPALDRLFQAALHAGRTAHAWFTGSPRSLADVALDRIAELAGRLEGRPVLVVGVGRMGRLAAFAAMRRGCAVLISNRGPEREAQLAHEVGGTTIRFGIDGALDGLGDLAGVVVAIGGEWVVGPRDGRRLVEQSVPVVDLSSPPALRAALQDALGSRLLSVDDLVDDNQGPGERVRRRLESLVSRTGRDYSQWIRTRESVPAIQALVEAAEAHRLAEVDWLRRRVPSLSEEDLGLVDQMSHRLVAALIHAPLEALNRTPSPDLERSARELFDV